MHNESLTFYEFFSGGGMARLGLGQRWTCSFANDVCEKKASAYRANFGAAPELTVRDVGSVSVDELPGNPSLVWASFPCQDLSLAGNGVGLNGHRSGTFWTFWKLMQAMTEQKRGAPLIVLENVVGAITSNAGRDFQSIVSALSAEGYVVGPIVINAVRFVPQSRPRLFVVAVDSNAPIPSSLQTETPSAIWHPPALRAAYEKLPPALRKFWMWWHLPVPSDQPRNLTDIIESTPTGVKWHSGDETKHLLRLMSRANLHKVELASQLRKRVIGTVYKRTRPNKAGNKVQRAEVRFDQISGCLRTPAGGSSRQTILVVNGDDVRSRLLSPREAARLMGVPDTYILPENYTEAYHLMGDGLVVPAVNWLETHLLYPLSSSTKRASEAA
jgi:DNA (cytosine-5)-methyltransferase 1